MGGPSWYRGVVSVGYPICSFRQFLARMCRFATIQNVTDRQTTTTTDDIGYQRRPYGRPTKRKNEDKSHVVQELIIFDYGIARTGLRDRPK